VSCGGDDVGRWDHLVPVSEGGETVLGNMVPCCAHCDDSKQHHGYAEWMRGNPRTCGHGVEERIAKIEAYVQDNGYKVRPLEDRLNRAEAKRLKAIRDRLTQARTDLEQLIQDYRARTGEG